MKKTILKFSVLAVIALAIFASCDPASDVAPVVTVTTPTADTTTVEIGSSVTFKVSLSTDNTLASFHAMSNTAGVTLDTSDKTFTSTSDEVVEVTATVTSEVAAGTLIEITFTGTDSEGLTNHAKKYILAKSSLSEATAFEWKRVGGTDGTGLEMFGLTWNSNTASIAVIKNATTKFVELDAAAWTTITTTDALKTAIDGATAIDKWEKVSVTANKTYDLTLGTIKEGVYYLIHVTNSTVASVAAGTTITVTGQYKK